MNEKRNASAGAATPTEATEALNITQTKTTSIDDDITEMQKSQGLIASHLRYGEENATSTKTLMAMLHINERQLRELVSRERMAGEPILAAQGKNSGYFLPADGKKGQLEMLKSYHLARSKAVGHLRAIAPIYRRLKACGALTPQEIGQISIEEAEEEQSDG